MSLAIPLVDAIASTARTLPDWAVECLATILRSEELAHDQDLLRAAALGCVVLARHRNCIRSLFETWEDTAIDTSPASIALALQCTSNLHGQSRSNPEISLVWTGPRSQSSPIRSIEQTLLDVIHSAQQTLLLVTFAAYRVPMIQDALTAANSRGVAITFIGEFTTENEQASFDPHQALGPEIALRCAIYIWPHDQREPSPTGHKGVLHAKCAIADDTTLLISSANLTDAALANNMELGVIIRNGAAPAQAKRHFQYLIHSGSLRRWQPA